ncbi:MAG: hypothetical protein OIN86_13175 [Candidatus Methanoperedens sp.]|nr:hypothetical protein [Candidatus Methanoperedens sp.]CAG0949244.1 hypothetical protein METP1_00092 [Methanosarcinales archaeon]
MEECIEDTKITGIRKVIKINELLGIDLTNFVKPDEHYSIEKEKDSDTIIMRKITDKRTLKIIELFELTKQIEKHAGVHNEMLLIDPEDEEKIENHIEQCVSCQQLRKRQDELSNEIE